MHERSILTVRLFRIGVPVRGEKISRTNGRHTTIPRKATEATGAAASKDTPPLPVAHYGEECAQSMRANTRSLSVPVLAGAEYYDGSGRSSGSPRIPRAFSQPAALSSRHWRGPQWLFFGKPRPFRGHAATAAARGHTATGLCGIPTRFPFNRAAAPLAGAARTDAKRVQSYKSFAGARRTGIFLVTLAKAIRLEKEWKANTTSAWPAWATPGR